jgi:hypothetical protein
MFDIPVYLFLSVVCCFAGVHAMKNPEPVARYFSLGRSPSETAVRYFRAAGIGFLVISLLATAIVVAFIAFLIYMDFHGGH